MLCGLTFLPHSLFSRHEFLKKGRRIERTKKKQGSKRMSHEKMKSWRGNRVTILYTSRYNFVSGTQRNFGYCDMQSCHGPGYNHKFSFVRPGQVDPGSRCQIFGIKTRPKFSKSSECDLLNFWIVSGKQPRWVSTEPQRHVMTAPFRHRRLFFNTNKKMNPLSNKTN